MKFCLTNDVQKSVLEKADEIKVSYYYRNKVLDLIEQYPDKTIILDTDTEGTIEWHLLKELNIMAKGNFAVCVYNDVRAKLAKEHGIKFYFGFVVTTWYDLNNHVRLGASYVRLGSPLIHMLDKVVETYPDLKIRAVPNTAITGHLPKEDGVAGDWIRPEDVEYYSQYIYVMEFEHCKFNPKKEQVYFNIYKDGEWAGDLQDIVPDLNYPGMNRLIPPDTMIRRAVCRQQCQEPNNYCKLCYTVLDLSNKQKLSEYADNFNLRS